LDLRRQNIKKYAFQGSVLVDNLANKRQQDSRLDHYLEEYGNLIKYHLAKYEVNYEEREDLFHSILLHLDSADRSIKHQDNITGWVSKVVCNAILTHFRSTNRYNTTFNSAPLYLEASDELDKEPDAEINRIVEESLKTIHSKYSQPFILHYKHGEKWVDVAESLDLNIDTVRKRAEKAKILLQKKLEGIF
jgi:RNA polymerase sigma factor (sigma-70 family)